MVRIYLAPLMCLLSIAQGSINRLDMSDTGLTMSMDCGQEICFIHKHKQSKAWLHFAASLAGEKEDVSQMNVTYEFYGK